MTYEQKEILINKIATEIFNVEVICGVYIVLEHYTINNITETYVYSVYENEENALKAAKELSKENSNSTFEVLSYEIEERV